MTVLNTNARSLCPKINSLVDCFTDLRAAIGIITETWLTDGDTLEEDIANLTLGTGLQMLYRNREANDQGFSHGGVAVVFKESMVSLKEVRLHNPHKAEVLMAAGHVKSSARKLVVIAAYIPP